MEENYQFPSIHGIRRGKSPYSIESSLFGCIPSFISTKEKLVTIHSIFISHTDERHGCTVYMHEDLYVYISKKTKACFVNENTATILSL